jgi:hypothetical protein
LAGAAAKQLGGYLRIRLNKSLKLNHGTLTPTQKQSRQRREFRGRIVQRDRSRLRAQRSAHSGEDEHDNALTTVEIIRPKKPEQRLTNAGVHFTIKDIVYSTSRTPHDKGADETLEQVNRIDL